MQKTLSEEGLQNRIKTAIIITIVGLLLNGISAVPLRTELNVLLSKPEALPGFLHNWWSYVSRGVYETSDKYNFMRYGFDWLALAHLLIAIAFIGPLREPVKNQWVVQWGMIAAFISVLMAIGWERLRSIPFWWSLLDASIGLTALIILWLCNRWINQLKVTEASVS